MIWNPLPATRGDGSVTHATCSAVYLLLDVLVKALHDTVSERLRRWTRNPLGSARRGSNPLAVARRRCAQPPPPPACAPAHEPVRHARGGRHVRVQPHHSHAARHASCVRRHTTEPSPGARMGGGAMRRECGLGMMHARGRARGLWRDVPVPAGGTPRCATSSARKWPVCGGDATVNRARHGLMAA